VELQEIKLQGMTYFEDFLEAPAALVSTVIAKATWTGGGTNGTQTVSASANGTMALATSSTASSTSILQFTSLASFLASKCPTFEALAQVSTLSNITSKMGLYSSGTNYAYVTNVNGVLSLVTNSNGAGAVTTALSGYPGAVAPVAATYMKVRIEVLPTVSGATTAGVNVWINDVQVPPSMLASNVVYSTATLGPYFYVDNAAAAVNNTLTIDYCQFSQNR
jgi:hypothetical protein